MEPPVSHLELRPLSAASVNMPPRVRCVLQIKQRIIISTQNRHGKDALKLLANNFLPIARIVPLQYFCSTIVCSSGRHCCDIRQWPVSTRMQHAIYSVFSHERQSSYQSHPGSSPT